MFLKALFILAAGVLLSGCLTANLGTGGSVKLADSVNPPERGGTSAPKPATHAKTDRPIFEAAAAPSYNVEKGCKAAAVLADDGGYDSCLKLELDAKHKLAGDWKSYSFAARQECLPYRVENFSESYVELMTCLEMKDSAKNPESVGALTGKGASPAVKHSGPRSTAKSVSLPEEAGVSTTATEAPSPDPQP